jgi:hypothetical protein
MLDVLTNFLPEFRPAREPAAECVEEIVVPLSGLRPRRRLGGIGQLVGRGEPEADKHGHHLDGDADVAPLLSHLMLQLARGFLDLGVVRCVCDQDEFLKRRLEALRLFDLGLNSVSVIRLARGDEPPARDGRLQ